MISLNVKQLENGTRYSYIYNGGPIESRNDRTAPFSMTLNDPYPQFRPWRWVYQKRCYAQTQFQWNTNRDLYALLNSVISNDLEWLSKIFNDTKRRAVSLRQLSFLFCTAAGRLVLLKAETVQLIASVNNLIDLLCCGSTRWERASRRVDWKETDKKRSNDEKCRTGNDWPNTNGKQKAQLSQTGRAMLRRIFR